MAYALALEEFERMKEDIEAREVCENVYIFNTSTGERLYKW